MTKSIKEHTTKWRTNPNGKKYRIHSTIKGFWVEYQEKPVLESGEKLKSFIVDAWGKTYHVKASTAEAAVSFFVSNSIPHSPKKNETIVKEVYNEQS